MQAITIAIGKTGIRFFAQELVVKELVNILSGLTPPDRTFQVPDIVYDSGSEKATNITIYLTQGKLLDFSPQFQSISQQSNGVFPMTMTAGNFSAQYNWEEKWRAWVYFPNRGGGGSWSETDWSPVDSNYPYPPAFSGLTVNVPLQFEYNNNKWSIVAGDSSGSAASSSANIPGNSIVQYQEGCFITHVSDATASAISAIDFGSSLNSLLDGNIASIPDSGNLGDGIVYDFSLGSAGIAFPNNDGIQMGVKGGASYNGTAFSGAAPPNLPFPLPPTDSDSHHLNMYVSNYEIDALYWAFWKAGKLDVVVNPTNLQDPNILKVKTYITAEPKLKPFQAFAMQAQISPAAAPSSAFQMVWVLNGTVMGILKQQLPTNIWNLLGGLQGNAYTTQSSFEQDLTDATIPSSYFQAIEKAAQSMGMVVNSSLNFDLIIQNQQPTEPDIKFTVARTDILSNLRLGIGANNRQTLQYDFTNVTFSTTFISSTVPGFIGGGYFSGIVWQQAGEPEYEKALAEMGGAGVPLPIMADFQFDFTNAELSIQQGYISILASVLYTNK